MCDRANTKTLLGVQRVNEAKLLNVSGGKKTNLEKEKNNLFS